MSYYGYQPERYAPTGKGVGQALMTISSTLGNLPGQMRKQKEQEAREKERQDLLKQIKKDKETVRELWKQTATNATNDLVSVGWDEARARKRAHAMFMPPMASETPTQTITRLTSVNNKWEDFLSKEKLKQQTQQAGKELQAGKQLISSMEAPVAAPEQEAALAEQPIAGPRPEPAEAQAMPITTPSGDVDFIGYKEGPKETPKVETGMVSPEMLEPPSPEAVDPAKATIRPFTSTEAQATIGKYPKEVQKQYEPTIEAIGEAEDQQLYQQATQLAMLPGMTQQQLLTKIGREPTKSIQEIMDTLPKNKTAALEAMENLAAKRDMAQIRRLEKELKEMKIEEAKIKPDIDRLEDRRNELTKIRTDLKRYLNGSGPDKPGIVQQAADMEKDNPLKAEYEEQAEAAKNLMKSLDNAIKDNYIELGKLTGKAKVSFAEGANVPIGMEELPEGPPQTGFPGARTSPYERWTPEQWRTLAISNLRAAGAKPENMKGATETDKKTNWETAIQRTIEKLRSTYMPKPPKSPSATQAESHWQDITGGQPPTTKPAVTPALNPEEDPQYLIAG